MMRDSPLRLSLLLCLAFLLNGVLCDPPPGPTPTREQTAHVYFATPDTLEHAAKPVLEKIEEVALSFKIPDIDQTVSTSLGKVEIMLNNMAIDVFSLDNVKISTIPDVQHLQAIIDEARFALEFDYKIQELSFPYKSENGTGRVSTNDLSILMEASGKQNVENGGIIVTTERLDFDVGDFEIDMEGGLVANIITALESMFKDLINDLISDTFSNFLSDIVDPFFDQLDDWEYHHCVEDYACMDHRLTADPKITKEGFFVYMKGTLYNSLYMDESENADLVFDELPDVVTGRLLNTQYSNAVFYSLLYSLNLSHLLDLWNPDTKEEEPAQLNYEDIVTYYPSWADAYPEGTIGKLTMTTIESPSTQIMYNGIKIIIKLAVSLVPDGLEDTTHITGNVEATYIGDFYYRDYHYSDEKNLTSRITELTLDLQLVSSTSSESLNKDWIEDIINNLYLPQVNYILDDAYYDIIALSNMSVTNLSVTYEGTYVYISSDFSVDFDD